MADRKPLERQDRRRRGRSDLKYQVPLENNEKRGYGPADNREYDQGFYGRGYNREYGRFGPDMNDRSWMNHPTRSDRGDQGHRDMNGDERGTYSNGGWGGDITSGYDYFRDYRRSHPDTPRQRYNEQRNQGARGSSGSYSHGQRNEQIMANADYIYNPNPWNQPGPHVGKGPHGYSRSDERIRDEIFDRLTRHGYVDATRVRVDVKNGEVILSGTVKDKMEKRMAEDTVEAVAGVKNIDNQIDVEQKKRS